MLFHTSHVPYTYIQIHMEIYMSILKQTYIVIDIRCIYIFVTTFLEVRSVIISNFIDVHDNYKQHVQENISLNLMYYRQQVKKFLHISMLSVHDGAFCCQTYCHKSNNCLQCFFALHVCLQLNLKLCTLPELLLLLFDSRQIHVSTYHTITKNRENTIKFIHCM